MSGFIGEALTFYPQAASKPLKRTVSIFPDDTAGPTYSITPFSPTKDTREKSHPKTSAYAMAKSPEKRAIRHHKPMLSTPTQKAPLRQNLNAPQQRGFAFDIPGRGSGKENIPPGMHVRENIKSKPINASPSYQMNRRVGQNSVSAKDTQMKPRTAHKKPSAQTGMTEPTINLPSASRPQSRNTLVPIIQPSASPELQVLLQADQYKKTSYVMNIVVEVVRAYRMFAADLEDKKLVRQSKMNCESIGRHDSRPAWRGSANAFSQAYPAGDDATSSSANVPSRDFPTPKRDQSVMTIQRAWRSYMGRRKEHECALDQARMVWATRVIARWWSGVKSSKKQEQKPRRKPVARRPAGQIRGRLGLRRL